MSDVLPPNAVSAEWDRVSGLPADDRRATIHPTGRDGLKAYRESGIAQASALAQLATAWVGSGARVLDYGCGDGRVLAEWDTDLFTLMGADTSDGMLRACAKRAPSAELLSPDDLVPGSVDVAYCLALLIHLGHEDGLDLACDVARAVRPGGLVVLDFRVGQPVEGGGWTNVSVWSESMATELESRAGLTPLDQDDVPWFVFRKD